MGDGHLLVYEKRNKVFVIVEGREAALGIVVGPTKGGVDVTITGVGEGARVGFEGAPGWRMRALRA